jgi:hypothetical protein
MDLWNKPMKLLLTIVFLSISFGVTATDTFDQSTGNLLIPVVIVGDQKYTNVLVTVDQLVSFGGFEQPAEKSVSTVRPDTYDLRRGQLIIPSVIVGDKEYRNLRITVKDVISYDGMGVKVADSGFNGEWYPEPYSLFVAEDLPQSVREGIAKTLDAGVELWGNFGPMEYWVLGTDSKAALKLQNLYCNQRVALQHQTEQQCEDEQNRRRSQGNNYFDYYLQLGLDAIEEDRVRGNAGVNGRREMGFQIIISSAPFDLMERTFENNEWFGSGHHNTALHEYWHVVNFAHLFNLDPETGIPIYGPPIEKKGPIWFTEGSAVYMASLGMAQATSSGKLPRNVFGDFWNHWQHMREAMELGLASKAEYPGSNLGDYEYNTDLGRVAAYRLGAWGIAYLLNKIGSQEALVDTMLPNLESLGWEGAFRLTFGLTSAEFYDEFEEFLKLSIDEQLEILPSIEGSY